MQSNGVIRTTIWIVLDPAVDKNHVVHRHQASGRLRTREAAFDIHIGEDELGVKYYANAHRMGIKLTLSLIFMHIRRGEYDSALALVGDDPSQPAITETCISALQDPEKIPRLQEELKTGPASEISQYGSLDLRDFCHALAGNFDTALDATIARANDNWALLQGLWRNHRFSSAFRQDQRFKDLLMELGLVDYYRENGWPDYCRPVGDEDFECD